MQFYQVKVVFLMEEGKKQNLNYLVDALSVTEAEAKTVKYLNNKGETGFFEVKAVTESKIIEVINA